jgi:hypothetical protein
MEILSTAVAWVICASFCNTGLVIQTVHGADLSRFDSGQMGFKAFLKIFGPDFGGLRRTCLGGFVSGGST